jgi:hypothetical protein
MTDASTDGGAVPGWRARVAITIEQCPVFGHRVVQHLDAARTGAAS